MLSTPLSTHSTARGGNVKALVALTGIVNMRSTGMLKAWPGEYGEARKVRNNGLGDERDTNEDRIGLLMHE
jgi:hypothetical protein